MRFDYLHEPRPPQFDRLLRTLGSKDVRAALLCLLFALASCGFARIVENHRVSTAAAQETASQAEYAASRARAQRLNLASLQTADLLSLEQQLETFRESGYRCARTLAALGTQLPPAAWLLTIAPRGGDMELTGRTFELATVGEVLAHLSGPQLGIAQLEHLDRIESPGSRPQFEFRLVLHAS